jgi:hypothetical protein
MMKPKTSGEKLLVFGFFINQNGESPQYLL